ncbi:MAG: lysyl oxidase family protein [Armatimonadota bacterium]
MNTLRVCRIALAAASLAGLATASGATPAAARKPLLPDLVPSAAHLAETYFSEEEGRTLLRFPTVILNLGDAPVEVVGRRKRRSDPMLAEQTLFYRGGKRGARAMGEFEFHEEHYHWHLLAVAEYRLLAADETVVAGGEKVSFCLMDTAPVDPPLPGARRKPHYLTCPVNRSLKGFVTGISRGWSDVYPANLYGQWVDVTGLPPGDYTLEVRLDPEGRLLEKSTENNTARVPVTIPPPAG